MKKDEREVGSENQEESRSIQMATSRNLLIILNGCLKNKNCVYMKFNWGTGILIFLILFLAACAAFIIFAMRQDVNLVHKDYYEKGVDHTDKMNVDARSQQFKNDFKVTMQNDFLVVNIEDSLSAKIDSGKVLMFRPSDSKQDIWYALKANNTTVNLPKENLISGRYILKVYWYSKGLKYEIDQDVNVE